MNTVGGHTRARRSGIYSENPHAWVKAFWLALVLSRPLKASGDTRLHSKAPAS